MANLLPALQLATRAAVAAGAALTLARLLELPFPVYAMIGAVLVTDLSPAQTRSLAGPRIIGTLVGACLGALLSPWAGQAWALGAGVMIAMFGCQALGLKDAARLAAYLCGIVLIEHADEPWTYAFHRVLETLLGIGIAVVVSLVPKLIRVPEPASPPPGG